MVIALDFDGTVVTHDYPEIGKEIGATPVLLALQNCGHKFILHTMRDNHGSGRNCLKEACDWFRERGIDLIGVNENPWQRSWTDSSKAFAQMYIDDSALGVPLKTDDRLSPRPFVDWVQVRTLLEMHGLLFTDTIEEK